MRDQCFYPLPLVENFPRLLFHREALKILTEFKISLYVKSMLKLQTQSINMPIVRRIQNYTIVICMPEKNFRKSKSD